MFLHKILLPTALVLSFMTGCLYTFSGSTLPAHLKTVEIPLFGNKSMEPDVADFITQELSREVVAGNLLRVVDRNGNATITGSVMTYENTPYTYGASSTRQVDVQQYVVRIGVEVEFLDNKSDNPIYKGTVTGEGIYSLATENEDARKQRAIKEVVQRILQNSVQGW